MAEAASTRIETVRFKLDGRELEVPAGTTIIRAAHAEGIPIPHFCYHPGLRPEGNCRMCLVEASSSRKPVPACTTAVTEGLEVRTDSELARAAQADVLEFLLLNHPLDCPICDKSGECVLQDNSYAHGRDHSRMVEVKELKPTKELGAGVLLWGNRCVSCTRCVRFTSDIAGSGELTMVNRGDRTVVDVFPASPLDNPLAGCVVDLCPVGALVSERFLYQARVWLEKRTDSVCCACARGCNVRIESLHNRVKRLVPRANLAVNDHWMCDAGRWDFDYVLGPRRWLRYRFEGLRDRQDAPGLLWSRLARVAAEHGPEAVGAVGSAFMTLEGLYLLRELLRALGAPPENLAARARPPWQERVFKGGFRIAADRNPNREGVRLVLGGEALGGRLPELLKRARSGRIRALIVVSDLPHHEVAPEVLEALGSLDFACLFLLEAEEGIPEEVALLPATAFTEREGTVINEDRRLQRLRRATELPRSILSETEVLAGALVAAGKRPAPGREETWFRELCGLEVELAGLSYEALGDQGLPLDGSAAP